jgi:hypothetical protein
MDLELELIVAAFNVPITLPHPLRRNQYLSVDGNVVSWTTNKKDIWILEQCADGVLIRNGALYLGALNGELYLYTQPHIWSIVSLIGDNIVFRHVEAKKTNIHLVVAAASDDDVRWAAAYDATVKIGAPATVWLDYIVANYTTLKDRTYFLTGAPFRHNPDILRAIECAEASIGPVLKITRDGGLSLENYRSEPALKLLQAAYSKQYRTTMIDHFLSRMPILSPTGSYTYTPGSLVSATRAEIHRRPLSDYTLMKTASGLDIAIIERLWHNIIKMT